MLEQRITKIHSNEKSELNNGTRHKQMNLHECLLTLFALMKWKLNADSVTLKP